MIRIKAPKMAVSKDGIAWHWSAYSRGDRAVRLYSESMHRRVLALVRACEAAEAGKMLSISGQHALFALRAQAEKEGKM